MKKHFISVFLMLVTIASVLPTTIAAESEYRIGPGDVLQIQVWREKDLSKEVLVLLDGSITFPLLGVVQASGRNPGEISAEVSERLRKYIPEPVVTVSVLKSMSNRIYVVGQVKQAGEIIATRYLDVMQALAHAGGLTPYAKAGKIKILRRVDGEVKSLGFDYNKVAKGVQLQQNILLKDGDVVVVP